MTKVVPPVVRKHAVERAGLMAKLDAFASCKLIVIEAPAGYGKTTLASHWCKRLRDSGAAVAWLHIDGDDNEPGAFAYHLTKAIENASPEWAQDALELFHASGLMPPRNVISAIVNAAGEIDGEAFLFLDDFHLLNDGECRELIGYLLRYAPTNVHVVVLTRAEPPLPLSRLRLEGNVAEIDATQLHFNLEETRRFVGSQLGEKLEPSGIAELHSVTEGWPAALQLACLSLRTSANPAKRLQDLSGSAHRISEYIAETLDALPSEIVQFLMKISILDQMNGALCEAVTGVSQSDVLLDRLEHQNVLLIPLDEDRSLYRCHHLLRDYLNDRLNSEYGDQVAEFHRRAYTWYAGEELWRPAVQHALAAKDYDRAFDFVAHCAMKLVAKGDLLTLLAWERQLPAELMNAQPEIKLALAWGMALVTRFKEANELLLQVEKATEGSQGTDLWWRCKAARATYYALTDDSLRSRNLATECLDGYKFDAFNTNALGNAVFYDQMKTGEWATFDAMAKPGLARDSAALAHIDNYRLCLLGMVAAQRLRCDDALSFYESARALAEKHVGSKSVPATMVCGLAARVMYERGAVEAAEISILDSLDIIETTSFHEGFLQSFCVLVRTARARGDKYGALSLLNRAERLCWERGWGRVVAALLCERARLLLDEGNLDEALSLLQAFEQLKSRFKATRRCTWSEIETYNIITKGLIASATRHWDDAIELLQSAYDILTVSECRLDALRIGLDLAIAQFNAGAEDKSFALLKQLLTAAAEENLVTFLHERKGAVAGIIAVARERGFLEHDIIPPGLLSEEKQTPGSGEPHRGRSVSATAIPKLTDRERSIVGFVAVGHSNKQIARELGVTPETIKTHLKRIFQKLSAQTRTQAVVRAHSFGLLEKKSISPHKVRGPGSPYQSSTVH